ncbi:TetR family transcriptional regulator [Nonomuraea africana]|uniref:TetR family transcriptional regulator n=1 Tax=Nonomuraea africana TaxID=46171 RepID=UPI00178AB802|nr:TetR family transcriptional regulator [Nonomuraea africana]
MDSTEELGRRDRKKLETRAALERAALTLVAERGLAGVTVEDIAEAVDVSSRTFFNYFPSKEDALLGRSPSSEAELLRRLADVPPQASALQALRVVLREEAERVQERREEWLLRLKVFEQNPSLLPKLISGGAESERRLAAAVAGRLGDDPAAAAHAGLVTAVALTAFRVSMMRWSTVDTSLAGLVDAAFEALAEGLPDPS